MATPWSGKTWTPSAQMKAGQAQWWPQQIGGNMWASGAYTGSGHWAFISFDLTSFALTNEFDTGLTAANQNGTWVTDGTNLYLMSIGSKILHKFTTAGVGSTLATLPTTCGYGLYFDGTFFWTVQGFNGGTNWVVYRISLGGTITSFTTGYSGNLHGGSGTVIFSDGSYLYLGNSSVNGLGVISLSSPTTMTALTTGDFANNAFTPGYFDGTNMWVTTTGPEIIKFPPGVGSHTKYTVTGSALPGISFDGVNLWMANYDTLSSPTHPTLFSCLPASPTVQTDYYQYNVSGTPTAFYGPNDTAGDVVALGRDNSGNPWAINFNTLAANAGQVAKIAPAPQGQLVYPFYKRLERRIWAPGWRKHDRLYLPAPVPLGAAA